MISAVEFIAACHNCRMQIVRLPGFCGVSKQREYTNKTNAELLLSLVIVKKCAHHSAEVDCLFACLVISAIK